VKPLSYIHDLANIGDPRDSPSYGIVEAAHYLRLPPTTLRSWVLGRRYPTREGPATFASVIDLPDRAVPLLSFFNLVEAHVLSAIRREHGVSLRKVRKAIRFLRDRFRSPHPLAERSFETDGIDLFIDHAGLLLSASGEGQIAMRQILRAHLRRIGWDSGGTAARLYLFTRKGEVIEPKVVVVDPRIAFGRPTLVGKGIPTSAIAERYKAGESIDSLARDYDCSREEIEEAIRCELRLEAA
jgi:uncharacterized protein (DUF433 family)